MQFYDNGNLEEGIYALSLEEFKNTFSTNRHRKEIFYLYEKFLSVFIKDIKEFELYVDGSYTTLKNKPNDIDVAIFIDIEVMQTKSVFLQSLKSNKSIITEELDIHFEPSCDKNSPYYMACLKRQAYWLETFSRDYKGNAKGIVSIHHKEENQC